MASRTRSGSRSRRNKKAQVCGYNLPPAPIVYDVIEEARILVREAIVILAPRHARSAGNSARRSCAATAAAR